MKFIFKNKYTSEQLYVEAETEEKAQVILGEKVKDVKSYTLFVKLDIPK